MLDDIGSVPAYDSPMLKFTSGKSLPLTANSTIIYQHVLDRGTVNISNSLFFHLGTWALPPHKAHLL